MSTDTFHSIILPLKEKLFRLAYGIVRDRAEAEDILQDLLLKLWSRKDEWAGIGNLEAYCFRAIKNMSLDRLASLAIRKTILPQREEQCYFVDNHSPHQELIRKEQRSMIDQCIGALPETQRLVFRLREVEEMSYRQIAVTLDISEELVKVSLFRARKRMKELLSRY
ncbi:MAG: sigma-70 family RNA polymerase sigma factor [Proteiniphilum sp.]|nr:sigma-70 family RNA polymerase sigma factor [Proteiniphilum sp.]